jgi:hypothetical protein
LMLVAISSSDTHCGSRSKTRILKTENGTLEKSLLGFDGYLRVCRCDGCHGGEDCDNGELHFDGWVCLVGWFREVVEVVGRELRVVFKRV